ncbi:hypothetical protein [Paenibacillus sp. 1A_MP2]|uniref:hypothetical protein n=1 Tax=Paenibacillus sp. 1A_MP2 TaxID=3457495 RepID=UPI003FCC9BE3
MSNELFGGSDLFSYFGGGFVEPTKVDKEETLKSVGNTIDITKRIQSRSKSDKSNDGSGVDTCEGLTQDEINALTDETPISESSADTAELGVKKDSSKNADSKDKEPVFTNTTYICYAGTSKLLTKYFDSEKIGLLSLEDVRKQLEKDFPEMSKQRTFMSFDEKKNIIIPAITGGKRGLCPFTSTNREHTSTLRANSSSIKISIQSVTWLPKTVTMRFVRMGSGFLSPNATKKS